MRLAWCNDLHFDFVHPGQKLAFVEQMLADAPDAILVGGDISVATKLEDDLRGLAVGFKRPVYFVLGNHDCYHSSIERVRELARGLTKEVKESIDSLAVTRVVIAHRLSTIRHADRIYVMDEGRVVQSGSFDELAAESDGMFARLMARQAI